MQKLKITVLIENQAGRWCRAEHGLSYLVEADRKILLDTGFSDLISYNTNILNIDLQQIDSVVLSHGHDDHTGGLMLLQGRKLICHPEVFLERYRKTNHTSLGIKWSEEEITSKFDLQKSRVPIWLSDQICFLGEIPRLNNFESKSTSFQKADGTEDFVADDTGLAVLTKNGLVVISGCAHSGICNMVAHAIEVTGISKVYLVIGGFHLQNDDSVTQKTIDWMKSMNVEQVVPAHCTGFSAQIAISKSFRFLPLKTGNIIEIE